ncbi:hypothetical protein HanRHA438_Chr04g0169581 [Helianthus annuus]|uniref:Putative RNA helicase SDE3 n=1 Tax=Helianthus annuus TaxID=4232 RepID=A0A251V2F2_HELAN|nr:hypothetical protein HanXRQr2_Chr04g0159381 [Helianthus annuus]KAJ0580600.1 hypothetical protein HanHA300_Chr04g0131121 [Helianthus annuus]KAJ0588220.1 hypothetical protein HanIR_Chr04g0172071 [Helianthus annuus]KAJ0596558.1 hypothetical protein HanHA89_Chr04g0144171 [Helianthus annuus]KAJ0757217.1 hypothetical protein HanLR1_Chr04g0136081 [Helianthus annuus]
MDIGNVYFRNNLVDEDLIGNVDFLNDASLFDNNQMDHGSVVISVPYTLVHGKPNNFVYVNETIFCPITIENTTRDALMLWSVMIYDSKLKNSFTLSLMKPLTPDSDADYVNSFLEGFEMEDRVLRHDNILTIWLSCKGSFKGLHTTCVEFTLNDEIIRRFGFVVAED